MVGTLSEGAMSERNTEALVSAYIERINRQDVEGIAELTAEDFLFVDAGDQRVEGRGAMRDAWRLYFAWVPDYRITVEEMLVKGPVAAVLGRGRGTYAPAAGLTDESRWDVPGAWKAVVRKDRIVEWRVYADNEPMVRLMAMYPPA
jgi:ketosteroid isomerase-like protein